MEECLASTPDGNSSITSTRSGHPPGTPRPPIDPPRRRSSLGFSRVLACDSSPQGNTDSTNTSPKSPRLLVRTPSNTGRKRAPLSSIRSTAMPGHVAQMQKLFQSAKASLRMDMRFAASPIGSIGSRLPPDDELLTEVETAENEDHLLKSMKTAKDWRYSTAPRLVAALDLDVREPFPESVLELPGSVLPALGHLDSLSVEPISSGFISPIDHHPIEGNGEPELPPIREMICHGGDGEAVNIALQHASLPLSAPTTDLEEPMTGLKVCSDDEDLDESPIISHLKRVSAADVCKARLSALADGEIFLSEPAKAAAESAKAKRGLLRGLFPRRNHEEAAKPTSESSEEESSGSPMNSPCPDPALHQLGYMTICPEPAAHYKSVAVTEIPPPAVSITPGGQTLDSQPVPVPTLASFHPPMPPVQIASSTGSPMPFQRLRPTQQSLGRSSYYTRQSYFSSTPDANYRPQQPYGPFMGRGYPSVAMTSEHFQPGWYYARDSSPKIASPGATPYSFSTAAAKVVGQSPAPDSRIRDSYRTDTLTPLARPPSRFRKTGISAFAGLRDVSKFYGEHGPNQRPYSRVMHSSGNRSVRMYNDDRLPRRPPRDLDDMERRQQKRRRPRDLEDERFEIREDDTAEQPAITSNSRLEEGEEVMEIDEQTRAAVRMSLYGNEIPVALQSPRQSIREICPNVTPWRKGMRQPRKKRRPSYWDSDLEQVRTSPAARHVHRGPERQVMTSPARQEIDVAQEGHISFNENDLTRDADQVEVELGKTLSGVDVDSGNAKADVDVIVGMETDKAMAVDGEEPLSFDVEN